MNINKDSVLTRVLQEREIESNLKISIDCKTVKQKYIQIQR